MSDLHQVITPENIELDYEIAGIGSRFLALTIDLTLQSLLTAGIFYGLSLTGLGGMRLEAQIKDLAHSLIGAGLLFLLGVVWLGYYVILETAMNGQTLGKRLLGIRVRKELGYAPSFWDILLRNLIRIIDFVPFGYAAGFITMFLNPNAKRLGDFAAGTIVIKELPRRKIHDYLYRPAVGEDRKVLQPEDQCGLYPWLDPVLPRLAQQDYFLLNNLYSRRNQLTNYHQLAQEMVQTVIRQIPGMEATVIELNEAPMVLQELIRRYEKAYFS